jgi:hypothetical protein
MSVSYALGSWPERPSLAHRAGDDDFSVGQVRMNQNKLVGHGSASGRLVREVGWAP